MYRIDIRDASAAELEILRSNMSFFKPWLENFGCWAFIYITFAMGFVLFFHSIYSWSGHSFFPLGPLFICIPLLLTFYFGLLKHGQPALKVMRKLAIREYQEKKVEEIFIKTSSYAWDELGSLLFFSLAGKKVLLLNGKWLYNPGVYGAPMEKVDTRNEMKHINKLYEPFAFPSDEFVIVRTPVRKEVISIKAQGKYIAPLKQIYLFPHGLGGEFGQVEILEGSLEDLKQAVESKD
ncbi:hypothetical protein ACFL35_13640 [Candidatus Riflebacteria bacterium]